MFKQLKALLDVPSQLECLGKRLSQTNRLTEECLQDFQRFMAIARRLDELNPERRAESDRIGAAAIAKMLAEQAARDKQEGHSPVFEYPSDYSNLLRRIQVITRTLITTFKSLPGEDDYTFEGSSNDVEDLREALNDLEDYLFTMKFTIT